MQTTLLPSEHNALKSRADQALTHLRSALAQAIPSDDALIIAKIAMAEMQIAAISDMLKAWQVRS